MRKSFRALLVAVTLAAALCVLSAAPALATYTHVFSTSFGAAGSGDGQLLLADDPENAGGSSGVAVNDSTHDVYVADTGNHRVDQFSATGAFIRAWGWGVADGTTEALQACTSGCHAGLSGTGAGELTEPSFMAVDNSGGPSEGDVYVADRSAGGATFIVKFSASGGYLSTNDGSGAVMPIAGPFGKAIGGIAVDSDGDLWVYADAKVSLGPLTDIGDVFEFAQDGSFITDWSTTTALHTTGIAVDSAHDLYLWSVYKYTPSGARIGEVQNGGIWGLAVNASSNDIYLDEGFVGHGEWIARYPSSCEPANGLCTHVEEFGAGGELNHGGGLAVDASNDTVYAVNDGSDQVAAFGRTPDVTTGAPGGRTPTAAMVSGSVAPDNTALSDCHFDYVADAEYQAGEPNPYLAGGVVPCDVTPAGAGAATVHAQITGLAAGIAYHYRLQATNAYGTSFGADETVPGTPPVIDSSSAADVTSESAEVRASINPAGGDTTYRFEYGPTTSYGASIPVPDADIGSGIGDVSVSRRLQGLLAGTVYHYRVLARNLLGTTFGPDRAITTQLSGGTVADSCPNAAIRARQRAEALPDCRAYEQVSPPDREGVPILGARDAEARWQAAPDGSAVTYTSSGVFADAQTGGSVIFPYLSSRAPGGWSTRSLLPPQSPGAILPFIPVPLFSSDLSKSILLDGGGGLYGQDQPAIVAGEPADNANLFVRQNSTGAYQLIDVTPPGVAPAEANLQLASSDLSHVFFTESAKLTADAPPTGAEPSLYEWSGGTVRLAGVLPDGTPVPSSQQILVPFLTTTTGGVSPLLDDHAVSDDGSRVVFQVNGTLYLREDASRTVQLDASQGAGPGGGGKFVFASSDGSRAFFMDDATAGLTGDTVPGSGVNLYRYDADGGALVDLTAAVGAGVLGVIGASEDGSYVYFAANGVLAPGASPGDCVNGTPPGPALAQTCNLYLWHNGDTRFLASLDGEDVGDWHQARPYLNDTAVVSPDGRYLAFQSLDSLTGYDSRRVDGGECDEGRPRCAEVFFYDAAAGPAGKLSCASCNPTGGAPVGSSLLAIPPKATVSPEEMLNYLPRYLSDSGRLFFNSRDALLPQDVNGQWDVYEYEGEGDGSCAQAQGCVSLISSGTSPDSSLFRDASVSGEDVFFTTSDRLVTQDGDQGFDLYDAKAAGGLEAQNEVSASSCAGEACRPPASPAPAEQAPGSSGLAGSGNLPAVASVPRHSKKKKHAVRKRGHHKARHHAKPRHARGKRVNHNRRGAK